MFDCGTKMLDFDHATHIFGITISHYNVIIMVPWVMEYKKIQRAQNRMGNAGIDILFK